jgi:hypothetical protein
MNAPATVAFTADEAERFYDEWRFNCGPSALCAVMNVRPEEALRVIPKFKERGYTNPKMMRAGLMALGATIIELRSEDGPVTLTQDAPYPAFGVVRIQWSGRWTNPGVPVRARYRHSHWIARAGEHAFDINCMGVGGWLPWTEWRDQVAPWLIRELEAKATGWWPTHCWEVGRP